jgi:hypothetical protein
MSRYTDADFKQTKNGNALLPSRQKNVPWSLAWSYLRSAGSSLLPFEWSVNAHWQHFVSTFPLRVPGQCNWTFRNDAERGGRGGTYTLHFLSYNILCIEGGQVVPRLRTHPLSRPSLGSDIQP